MPEVIINGPEGRIECRYMPAETPDAPTALILHPEPDKGGSMNNKVTYALYKHFQSRGFAVMRFNFRGVGRSQGTYNNGEGELSDAATAMDWLQAQNPASRQCWIAGFSFGSWIGMQLMMRRPEIRGFISVAPPAITHDFSFLAPCPASGLIINGEEDTEVPPDAIHKLVERLSIQKGVKIDINILAGANHFFSDHLDPLIGNISDYLDNALSAPDFDPLA
ncbi:alpha/beta hydrolase [Alphaproteobacteria bacterium]|nr:alpha/beta hydrolase [Alphaproteobacteria bacterium]